MFQDLSHGTSTLSKIKQQIILNWLSKKFLKPQKQSCTMPPPPPGKHFDPISTPWRKGEFTMQRTVIARGWWIHDANFFDVWETFFCVHFKIICCLILLNICQGTVWKILKQGFWTGLSFQIWLEKLENWVAMCPHIGGTLCINKFVPHQVHYFVGQSKFSICLEWFLAKLQRRHLLILPKAIWWQKCQHVSPKRNMELF